MKSFSASANINASSKTIWKILTDASSYPSWDPNMERLEGTIGPGRKIVAHTRLSPRPFPVKVTEFVPSKKMVWTGGMPLGLFKGVRTFTLTPKDNGTVDFVLREEFSGLLLGVIGKSIPDMTQAFEDFAAALKARAESA